MAITGRGTGFSGWRDRYWGEPLLGAIHAVRNSTQMPPKDAAPAVWLDWFLSVETGGGITGNCSLVDAADTLSAAGTSPITGNSSLTDASDTISAKGVAADIVDEFNRTNGSLGTGWTDQRNSPQINTNMVRGNTAAAWSVATRNETFSNDQKARVRNSDNTHTSWCGKGVVLRCTDGNNFYYSNQEPNDGHLYVGKVVANVTTEWDAGLVTFNVGDVLEFEVSGTTLTTRVNGTQVDSRTDATLTSGKPGVIIYSNETSSIDDFAAWGVASSGITGNASLTDAADTLSADGTIQIQGAASLTDASDALSASGTMPITGSSALSDAVDTISAAGAVTIVGVASLSDGSDTLSAAGTVGTVTINGDCSLTDASDTLSANGVVAVSGSSSLTDAGDSIAAAGTILIAGSASLSDGADSLSAAGSMSIVGSVILVDSADTLSAAGTVGSTLLDCALVDASDVLSATGALLIVGNALLVDDSDILLAGDPVRASGGADGNWLRRKKHFKGPVYRKTIETFQKAKLRSGRVDGPLVVDPRQARAIAYKIEEKDNLKRGAQDDDDEMFNPFNKQG